MAWLDAVAIPFYSERVDRSINPLAPDLAPVLETALDAVVVMAEDGVVAGWNPVAEQIFGWSRDEAVGAQLSDLIIPVRFREAHHQGLQKYLETGVGPVLNSHIEISGLRRSGEEFPVELSITPTDGRGQRLFIGFLRDITERKAAEQTIRRRAAEAEAISALTTLAAECSSFELVMARCLEAVCDITGWKLGHAFSCVEDQPELLVETGIWHVPTAIDVSRLIKATEALEFRAGVGLPGRALEERAPVWLTDVEKDTNFPRAETAAAHGLHSAFAFPILSGSRTIAVVEFFHDAVVEPDRSLWPTFKTLGEQVGRVFERTSAAEMLRSEHEALLAEMERRKMLEEHQQLLLNELEHRVKNTLAVVAAIAHQTGKNSSSVTDFMHAFSGRLTALATAHSLLTRKRWQSAPLDELVNDLVGAFCGADDRRVSFEGPEITVEPSSLLALSLVLHELLTNALKHGALSTSTGSIHIQWNLADEDEGKQVNLCWRETGVDGLRQPERPGFGSKLLDTSVRRELQGTITTDWKADGLELHLQFPLNDS